MFEKFFKLYSYGINYFVDFLKIQHMAVNFHEVKENINFFIHCRSNQLCLFCT